jgi:hypothetical protein
MRMFFFILIWLPALLLRGQVPVLLPLPEPELNLPTAPEFNTTNAVVRAVLLGISGYTEGTAEALKFKYSTFQAVHPGANPGYWNPVLSWKNKYRDEDPSKGPAFFGSTTFLVWTTDGYHAMRTVSRTTGAIALTVPVWSGECKKLRHYAAELAGSYLIWTAGFNFAFHGVYK